MFKDRESETLQEIQNQHLMIQRGNDFQPRFFFSFKYKSEIQIFAVMQIFTRFPFIS